MPSDAAAGATSHRRLTMRVRDLHVSYRTTVTSRSSKARASKSRRVDNQVLHGISFDTVAGEFIGVVGTNGSGKSTLLKALGGFIPHQAGSIEAVAHPQLLSVSAAMKPNMSGWENILLGCLALGVDYRDMDELMDDVAEFCELGDRLDLPMKALSSGEKARLQFGIATVRTPEIFMLDEALSVGDKRFREKGLARMNAVLQHAGTVFYVSHNLNEITKLCNRTLWIKDGLLGADGSPEVIVEQYVDHIEHQGADKRTVQQASNYRRRRKRAADRSRDSAAVRNG
jgi:teichoic acid transport system ATP-binding protein